MTASFLRTAPRALQVRVGSILLAASAGGAAHAQPGPDPYQALIECRALAGDAERLACLDARLAAFAEAVDSGEVTVVDERVMERAERENFGFAVPNPFAMIRAGRSGGEGQAARTTQSLAEGSENAGDAVEILRDRDDNIEALRGLPVASVTANAFGRITVVLENGQQWRQTDTRRLRPPRSGQPVTAEIERGAIGSFFMTLSHDDIRFRAERVQ